MRHILADPSPALPVPLGSVDSDSLLLWMVTKTKVISRSQRDLKRAVVLEPRVTSSFLPGIFLFSEQNSETSILLT